MQVKDITTRTVLGVAPDTSVLDVVMLLLGSPVCAVSVVLGAGKVVGRVEARAARAGLEKLSGGRGAGGHRAAAAVSPRGGR